MGGPRKGPRMVRERNLAGKGLMLLGAKTQQALLASFDVYPSR